MSFLPPGQTPQEVRGLAARSKDRENRLAKTIEQQAMLNQGDEGISETPRRRGAADRLRSVFRRGDSPARPPKDGVSDQDV
jgi:hypothetical protein